MPQTIGIKELYKKLPEIAKKAQQGQAFLVQRHSHPLFLISPYEKDTLPEKKLHTLSELFSLRSTITEENISTSLDKHLYK
jgi:antitoxin (DNA-binding transcriptional repressor) of toxin-antitoxin stability system